MNCRHVKLIQPKTSHPIRWTCLADRSDKLPPEMRPAILARDSVPALHARFRQRILTPYRGPALVEFERLSGRAARLQLVHGSRAAIVGQKSQRIATHLVFFQYRPVFKQLRRASVALPSPLLPMFAVPRNSLSRPMEDASQSLLLPSAPLILRPIIVAQKRLSRLVCPWSIAQAR